MRLEFHGYIFIMCIILLILVWGLRNNDFCKPYLIFMFSFCGALLLPAWVPGHSEIIVALPNVALFFVANTLAWGVGIFYLLINFFISYAILNTLTKYSEK